MSIVNIDFRLFDAESELYELGEFHKLLENKIDEEIKKEKEKFQSTPRYDDEDSDWYIAKDTYYMKADFSIPWLLRPPFIIMLHATFENTVTEIAELLRKKKDKSIKLDDLKGDLLTRSQKYFKDILELPISTDNKCWQQIPILAKLRNIYAHSNGRLDLINDSTKEWLTKQKKDLNIKFAYGYVVLSKDLLTKLFKATKSVLKDLIDRYKEFDDQHRTKN